MISNAIQSVDFVTINVESTDLVTANFDITWNRDFMISGNLSNIIIINSVVATPEWADPTTIKAEFQKLITGSYANVAEIETTMNTPTNKTIIKGLMKSSIRIHDIHITISGTGPASYVASVGITYIEGYTGPTKLDITDLKATINFVLEWIDPSATKIGFQKIIDAAPIGSGTHEVAIYHIIKDEVDTLKLS